MVQLIVTTLLDCPGLFGNWEWTQAKLANWMFSHWHLKKFKIWPEFRFSPILADLCHMSLPRKIGFDNNGYEHSKNLGACRTAISLQHLDSLMKFTERTVSPSFWYTQSFMTKAYAVHCTETWTLQECICQGEQCFLRPSITNKKRNVCTQTEHKLQKFFKGYMRHLFVNKTNYHQVSTAVSDDQNTNLIELGSQCQPNHKSYISSQGCCRAGYFQSIGLMGWCFL